MTTPRDYEYYKNKPLPELAKLRFALNSSTALPQLAYEEKLLEQKHELDLKLLIAQAEMMKSSNRLIAISTISAALLGAVVGAVLQYKLTQKTEIPTAPKIGSSVSSSPPQR